METTKITRTLLRRLPLYLEYLKQVEDTHISATTIATALAMGEVQVRKDLAQIAGTGRCRTGRSRDQLIWAIEASLSEAVGRSAILVVGGEPGQELLTSSNLEAMGVVVVACFSMENDWKRMPSGCPVYPINRLGSFCKYYNVSMGIIAVPEADAQAVCDCLVACGIKAIWNFAPVHLNVPEHVVMQSEDLAASIISICARAQSHTRSK
jgi:redox-sensing transcriptional repressor